MFAIANRTFTRQDHFTRHIQLCTTDDQIVPSFVEEHELFNAGSIFYISDTIDLNNTQIYDNNLRESSDLNVSDVVAD